MRCRTNILIFINYFIIKFFGLFKTVISNRLASRKRDVRSYDFMGTVAGTHTVISALASRRVSLIFVVPYFGKKHRPCWVTTTPKYKQSSRLVALELSDFRVEWKCGFPSIIKLCFTCVGTVASNRHSKWNSRPSYLKVGCSILTDTNLWKYFNMRWYNYFFGKVL